MTTSLDAHAGEPSPFDPHQSSSALTFEMGLLVPVQFYDLIRRNAFLDGETLLVFAVLEDAVRTYLRQRSTRRRADHVEFAEVARWFEAKNGVVPFSFEYVCEVLELEPESFRRPAAYPATSSAPDEAVAICRTAPACRKHPLREEASLMGGLDGKIERFAAKRRDLRALEQVGQRRRVQNARRRLAHIAHQKPDGTTALVVTLLASTVRRLARARQRSERSLDRA
jgi:hypothetical protein